MRLGIAAAFPHSDPEEWAVLHKEAGLGAVVFPLSWDAPVNMIDRYAAAARACDLTIAEVGIWNNPMDPDPVKRAANRTRCLRQLELAEYVGKHPVTVNKTLKILEAKGFIEQYPDPDDRRIKRICLLEKGHACSQEIARHIRDTEQSMAEGFSPQELSLLRSFLKRAIGNLNQANQPNREE